MHKYRKGERWKISTLKFRHFGISVLHVTNNLIYLLKIFDIDSFIPFGLLVQKTLLVPCIIVAFFILIFNLY